MVYLYYCPQMADLAGEITRQNPGVLCREIQWADFKDGFPNLKLKAVDDIQNQDVAFLASFDSPGEIFRQLSVIYEIPRALVRSFKVLLPFYPTGTMERVTEPGEIATAATLARMLSATPHTMSGPTQLVIFDIHAPQERFYFSDSIIPRLESAVPLLINRLETVDDVAIAFPDDGAVKRFGKLLSEYDSIVCHKVREGNQRVVTVKEGDPAGKHVVIVDDLVMTGGTLLECRKALADKGAEQVSAYVSHGVFPRESWKKFPDAGFSRFWLTDSCPATVQVIRNIPPFEILSLGESLGHLIG